MDFDSEWDIEGTARYLAQRQFKRPALQFPDVYLAECKAVADAVRSRCEQLGHLAEVRVIWNINAAACLYLAVAAPGKCWNSMLGPPL